MSLEQGGIGDGEDDNDALLDSLISSRTNAFQPILIVFYFFFFNIILGCVTL